MITSVINDLDLNMDNYDELINIIKAEEKVRADIAEANYKKYLASMKPDHNGGDLEDLSLLAMEAIDNQARIGSDDHGDPEPSQIINRRNKKGKAKQSNKIK